MWIGGMNPSGDNVNWEWTDGSAWDYQTWKPNEPNSMGEQYVRMIKNNRNGKWADAGGAFKYRPLCRTEMAPTPSPTTAYPTTDPTKGPSASPTTADPTKGPSASPTTAEPTKG